MMLSNAVSAPKSYPIIPPEYEYVGENWRKVFAVDCPENLRYVRVLNGVASLTNGRVLLRAFLPSFNQALKDFPNGLYTLTEDNHLRPARNGWKTYPDVELWAPTFDARQKKLVTIPNKEGERYVLKMFQWVRDVCSEVRSGSEYGDATPWFVFSKGCVVLERAPNERIFKCPIDMMNEVRIEGRLLELALMERVRYDSTIISREEGCLDEDVPLVFGSNWAECSVIIPGTRRTRAWLS